MKKKTGQGEEGFVLVWSLLLMVVLLLLGTSGIGTSIFETQMAANSALHKQVFYQADGGTEVGLDLLKQNINCISGFASASFGSDTTADPYTGGDGGIHLNNGKENFWVRNNILNDIPAASDTNRDLFYPFNYPAGAPHTNVRINGRTKLTTGAAIEMTAGYEGRGKSIGQDGAGLVYDINAQYMGVRNSVSTICTKYRVDSQFAGSPAGDCLY